MNIAFTSPVTINGQSSSLRYVPILDQFIKLKKFSNGQKQWEKSFLNNYFVE